MTQSKQHLREIVNMFLDAPDARIKKVRRHADAHLSMFLLLILEDFGIPHKTDKHAKI